MRLRRAIVPIGKEHQNEPFISKRWIAQTQRKGEHVRQCSRGVVDGMELSCLESKIPSARRLAICRVDRILEVE